MLYFVHALNDDNLRCEHSIVTWAFWKPLYCDLKMPWIRHSCVNKNASSQTDTTWDYCIVCTLCSKIITMWFSPHRNMQVMLVDYFSHQCSSYKTIGIILSVFNCGYQSSWQNQKYIVRRKVIKMCRQFGKYIHRVITLKI